jgi:hypothetical protein
LQGKGPFSVFALNDTQLDSTGFIDPNTLENIGYLPKYRVAGKKTLRQLINLASVYDIDTSAQFHLKDLQLALGSLIWNVQKDFKDIITQQTYFNTPSDTIFTSINNLQGSIHMPYNPNYNVDVNLVYNPIIRGYDFIYSVPNANLYLNTYPNAIRRSIQSIFITPLPLPITANNGYINGLF